MIKKVLPIGNDNFRKIQEGNYYYVDKSLLIKDFIEYKDEAALITRPRRFGKTLNMTMLREFFDISKDSRAIFEGLAIMNTEYAEQINSKPVIFLTFKDCRGETKEALRMNLAKELLDEYSKYAEIFDNCLDKTRTYSKLFYANLSKLQEQDSSFDEMASYLKELVRIVYDYYHTAPILLIDEYDQPILSSYENRYHAEVKGFFSAFFGSALKGNEYLGHALLTGIQRAAKESIFSQLNNIKVYTVIDRRYSGYFGLTKEETERMLEAYGLELNEAVKQKYDGYQFGGCEVYNPWSLLYYAESGVLKNYWINTSTNYLIKETLQTADIFFKERFHLLIQTGQAEVSANLELSFIELQDNSALWGLLINSGYITVMEQLDGNSMLVRIPNDEVRYEFQKLLAEQANISNDGLQAMFRSLLRQDMAVKSHLLTKMLLTSV